MAKISNLHVTMGVATTSAVSVAIYYFVQMRMREQTRTENCPETKDPAKPSSDATVNAKKNHSDEGTRAKQPSSDSSCALNEADSANVSETRIANAALKSPSQLGVPLRAVAQNGESNTVIVSTNQGHKIEGVVASKEDLKNTDDVVSTPCLVENKTKIVTFSLIEDSLSKDPAVCRPNDDGSSNTNRSKSPPEKHPADQSLAKHEKCKKGDKASSRSRARRFHAMSLDDSDAVIMISAEDLAMMEQLLLQMEDDAELFDCGDEMGRQHL